MTAQPLPQEVAEALDALADTVAWKHAATIRAHIAALQSERDAMEKALLLIAASKITATGTPPVPDLTAEQAWNVARDAIARQEGSTNADA